MSRPGLIILKFGGSVLRDENSLRLAVHEIYRWRRTRHDVIAVVSALNGQTDRLLQISHSICDSPSPEAVAAWLSTGELSAAALLGLHLDRAGIPACVLTPASIGLNAAGHALDADPVSLNEAAVRSALARDGVAIVPGFVAHDASGRPVLLGRGGSDLTALFLARRLAPCRCRLIKDVDGLYAHNPAAHGPAPARYARATWDDAERTDGVILQRKALRFACVNNVTFEVAALNGSHPTLIGADRTALAEPEYPRRLRVALLGLGAVGGGVFDLLTQMPQCFEIVAVAVRDADKRRAPSAPGRLLTTDAVHAAACGADVVVEAIGGLQPAEAANRAALRAGAHVVTANKALLAAVGHRLSADARSLGRSLRCSAAVGGALPVLEWTASLACRGIRRVRAVLNGTTNFVLDQLASGAKLDNAILAAQRRGLAERNPDRDLSGRDAAEKLCVIAQFAGSGALQPEDVVCEPLDDTSWRAARRSTSSARVVRQVATLHLHRRPVAAEVRLCPLDPADALANVPGEGNAVEFELNDGARILARGRGAGRWPTAEAVVADLLDIARAQSQPPRSAARMPRRCRGRVDSRSIEVAVR